MFEATLRSNPRQIRESWYTFFFQLPRVPEWFQCRDDFVFMTDARHEARVGAFTDEDLRRYPAAWSQDGALTGMVNWYRALFRHTETPSWERVARPS